MEIFFLAVFDFPFRKMTSVSRDNSNLAATGGKNKPVYSLGIFLAKWLTLLRSRCTLRTMVEAATGG